MKERGGGREREREREGRVWGEVFAARRVADGGDALGIEARAVLPRATGLSDEGVELALTEHLETAPSDAEIAALVASVEPAPAAHVVLSAAVFVAAHRALALALAASDVVYVKPSRRDPDMVRLLARATTGSFEIVDTIAPRDEDVVFAYGSDEALAGIRAQLPASVRFRGHGTGFGVAAVELAGAPVSEFEDFATKIVRDVVPFDQRGCLSPRIVAVEGSDAQARVFSEALAAALADAERRVPRGQLSADEAAQISRFRDALRYAGEIFAAGPGWVGLENRGGPAVLAPVGRNLTVIVADHAHRALAPLSQWITAVGIQGSRAFADSVTEVVPHARTSVLGRMQKPPFDGPVDVRACTTIRV